MNNELTLYKQHLQYDAILQRMYNDFLFAETINNKILFVHTLSGSFRVSVKKIRYFAFTYSIPIEQE